MVKQGHGAHERSFNRKKVRITSVVAKINKNKRIQKGVFNINENNRALVPAKKIRREQRKQEKKASKKSKVQELKAEKNAEMDTE